MSLNVEVEALRRVPIFKEIDPAKLRILAFISERVSFKPGEHLFHEGEPGDAAYIIMEGVADVVKSTDQGDLTVASLRESDMVGEIAIICDVPRTATVVASTDLNVLTISKENFLKFMTDFPDMALEVMRVLALRLERTTRDLADLQARHPEAASS